MMITNNGVKLTFDNNCIIKGDNKPPILSVDGEDVLTEVAFDGYYIISKDKVKNVVEEDGSIKSIFL